MWGAEAACTAHIGTHALHAPRVECSLRHTLHCWHCPPAPHLLSASPQHSCAVDRAGSHLRCSLEFHAAWAEPFLVLKVAFAWSLWSRVACSSWTQPTSVQSLPMVLERQLGEPVQVPCYGDVRRATRRASPVKERSLCTGKPPGAWVPVFPTLDLYKQARLLPPALGSGGRLMSVLCGAVQDCAGNCLCSFACLRQRCMRDAFGMAPPPHSGHLVLALVHCGLYLLPLQPLDATSGQDLLHILLNRCTSTLLPRRHQIHDMKV